MKMVMCFSNEIDGIHKGFFVEFFDIDGHGIVSIVPEDIFIFGQIF